MMNRKNDEVGVTVDVNEDELMSSFRRAFRQESIVNSFYKSLALQCYQRALFPRDKYRISASMWNCRPRLSLSSERRSAVSCAASKHFIAEMWSWMAIVRCRIVGHVRRKDRRPAKATWNKAVFPRPVAAAKVVSEVKTIEDRHLLRLNPHRHFRGPPSKGKSEWGGKFSLLSNFLRVWWQRQKGSKRDMRLYIANYTHFGMGLCPW